ncbi:MAG: class I SAM-dependent methyltransferase [Anaerolineales bacterium]|jgi:SAM-dependent methyltransferase
MEPIVLQKIRSINREFYQTFADSFAETRGRLQAGVQRLMPMLLRSECILDLGCGNGELAATLADQHFKGRYLGIDLSEQMLVIARDALAGHQNYVFTRAEIGVDELESTIRSTVAAQFHPPYDLLVAFSALHHIPGSDMRQALVRELHKLTRKEAKLSISVWNFLDSDRLRERILPWQTVGLRDSQVEPGDFLIDWRRDGQGIRYVHHFTEADLANLAKEGDFNVEETFYSDGETGTLGLYQVWTCH